MKMKVYRLCLSLLMILTGYECQNDEVSIAKPDGFTEKGNIERTGNEIHITNVQNVPLFYSGMLLRNITDREFSPFGKEYITDAGGRQLLETNSDYVIHDTVILKLVNHLSSTDSRITIDSVHGNLYWSDNIYCWISMTSLLPGSVDKAIHKVVVDNMDNIGDITCSPRGYLFWIQNLRNPVIWRSDLQGKSKSVVIYRNLVRPNEIKTDPVEPRIYWLDSQKDVLEYSTFDGYDRGIIPTGNMKLLGFAILNSKAFLVHNTTTITSVQIQMEYNVYNQRHIYETEIRHLALNRLSAENRTADCLELQCSQFCIRQSDRPMCMCGERYNLHADGHSCLAPDGYIHDALFIIISGKLCYSDREIFIHPLADVKCFELFDDLSAIDIDIENKRLFLVRRTMSSIVEFKIDQQTTFTVVVHNQMITDIAYDWIENVIYWSSQGPVYKLDLGTGGSELLLSIGDVGEIEIDPVFRRLFGVDGTSIVVYSLDGGKTEIDAEIEPRHLKYRTEDGRLYFTTDNGIKRIGHDITGTETVALLYHKPGPLNAFKRFLFWEDSSSSSDKVVIQAKDLGGSGTTFSSRLRINGTVNGFAMLYATEQKPFTGTCTIDNGQCQQICIPAASDDEEQSCSCEPGFHLSSDTPTCQKNHVGDKYYLINDESTGKLSKMDFVTGILSAPVVEGTVISVKLNKASGDRVLVYSNDVIERHNIPSNTTEKFEVQGPVLAVYHSTSNTLVYVNEDGDIGSETANESKLYNVTSQKGSPVDMALHDEKGMVYISEKSQSFIRTFNIKTSKSDILRLTVEVQPTKIVIDDLENHIFCIDSEEIHIMRVNLENGQVTFIHREAGALLVDIDVEGSYLYFIGSNIRYIGKLHKENNNRTTIWVSPFIGKIKSINVDTNEYCTAVKSQGNIPVGCQEKKVTDQPSVATRIRCIATLPFITYLFFVFNTLKI